MKKKDEKENDKRKVKSERKERSRRWGGRGGKMRARGKRIKYGNKIVLEVCSENHRPTPQN
jgi:hypothetical protein